MKPRLKKIKGREEGKVWGKLARLEQPKDSWKKTFFFFLATISAGAGGGVCGFFQYPGQMSEICLKKGVLPIRQPFSRLSPSRIFLVTESPLLSSPSLFGDSSPRFALELHQALTSLHPQAKQFSLPQMCFPASVLTNGEMLKVFLLSTPLGCIQGVVVHTFNPTGLTGWRP